MTQRTESTAIHVNDRKDPPRGLMCRQCGCGHFRVLYTRRALGGRLLRRRECRHCGQRMTTYEQSGSTVI